MCNLSVGFMVDLRCVFGLLGVSLLGCYVVGDTKQQPQNLASLRLSPHAIPGSACALFHILISNKDCKNTVAFIDLMKLISTQLDTLIFYKTSSVRCSS